ncbi:recombinase family protein [Pseudacidovorax intermedius]|uniref:recombinase family protein n=1 Tax=Pseudacidovorax intermedius TaxID=433924 RepID=UPI0025E384BE|nr:recombinase family protein [Pseudacidovorax intermedius]
MKVGYARVSTDEQHLDLQLQALEGAGCDVVFSDQGVSGAVFERPGLTRALRRVRRGDTLVVWKLDRLGRSLGKLVQVVGVLRTKQVDIASLSEAIDTGTPGGTFLFHLMAALAEFERSLISERTRAGLAAAKKRGRRIGRPPSIPDGELASLIEMAGSGVIDIEKTADQYKVHPRTLKRHLVRAITARA